MARQSMPTSRPPEDARRRLTVSGMGQSRGTLGGNGARGHSSGWDADGLDRQTHDDREAGALVAPHGKRAPELRGTFRHAR